MVDDEFFADSQNIIQQMMKIPALKSFRDVELTELLNLSEIKHYEPGDRIIREGSYDGRIYYLISGKVKIVKRSKTLLHLQRIGDVFGEMGFLEGKASSASVYASEKVMCLAIDVSDIERFSSQDQLALRYLLYREFAQVLAHRLRMTTDALLRAKKQLEKTSAAGT